MRSEYKVFDEYGQPALVKPVMWVDTVEPPRFVLVVRARDGVPLVMHRDRLLPT